MSVTINIVSPPPQGTAGPKARPLQFLTRAELGREFELACREALAEWRHRRRGDTVEWWRHAAVERVLVELGRRYLEEQDELEARYRLYAVM